MTRPHTKTKLSFLRLLRLFSHSLFMFVHTHTHTHSCVHACVCVSGYLCLQTLRKVFAFNSSKCATCVPREYKTHLRKILLHPRICTVEIHWQSPYCIKLKRYIPYPFWQSVFHLLLTVTWWLNHCTFTFFLLYKHANYTLVFFTVSIAERVFACRYTEKRIYIFISPLFFNRTAVI